MFGRVITAMVTPFYPDGTINYDEATRLALHLINNGTDSLVLCGTTGESPTLTHDEELTLFKVITKAVNGKAKIIAGTGSNCTKTAIEMTKKATDIGVDATLQVTPYYNKPSQAGIIRHIEAIATATSLPIMLYNIPSRTGTNIEPSTIATLADIDHVVALKEAGGSINQFNAISAIAPKKLSLYSGDDALTVDFLKSGAIGVVSVASHLVGSAINTMIHSFFNGDIEQTTKIKTDLMPLFNVLFITSNPTPIKYALALQGFNVGETRLPLIPPTELEMTQIQTILNTSTLQKYLINN